MMRRLNRNIRKEKGVANVRCFRFRDNLCIKIIVVIDFEVDNNRQKNNNILNEMEHFCPISSNFRLSHIKYGCFFFVQFYFQDKTLIVMQSSYQADRKMATDIDAIGYATAQLALLIHLKTPSKSK